MLLWHCAVSAMMRQPTEALTTTSTAWVDIPEFALDVNISDDGLAIGFVMYFSAPDDGWVGFRILLDGEVQPFSFRAGLYDSEVWIRGPYIRVGGICPLNTKVHGLHKFTCEWIAKRGTGYLHLDQTIKPHIRENVLDWLK